MDLLEADFRRRLPLDGYREGVQQLALELEEEAYYLTVIPRWLWPRQGRFRQPANETARANFRLAHSADVLMSSVVRRLVVVVLKCLYNVDKLNGASVPEALAESTC